NPFDKKTRLAVESARENIQLLVVLLDTNPYIWGKRRSDQNQPSSYKQNLKTLINFSQFLNHVLLFTNAYLSSNSKNKIAFIAAHPKESKFLFPHTSTDRVQSENATTTTTGEQDLLRIVRSDKATEEFFLKEINFNTLRNTVIKQLEETFTETDDELVVKGSSLAGAFSRALCFINRLEREKPIGTTLNSRVLAFQVSPDISMQYISIMNAIFSAQKMNVTLDSCILSTEDSSFLQQASYITGGVYLKPLKQEGLIQYLLSVFIVDKSLRGLVQLPVQATIDFRAACFETKKQIDLGYVCSVCLSIFDQHKWSCSTCGVKFEVLQQVRTGAIQPKPKPGSQPTNNTQSK
ncbi:transcription initiation factor TFIIH subunit 3, partial [Acrasis kona]